MPSFGRNNYMRVAIYNPYLDTLGGGERYTLSFACALAKKGHTVDVEWENQDIKELLEKRFGMDLGQINIVSDVKKGDGYDICFWVSDGSIPLMHARRNILHFQVPFHNVSGKSLINRMKLFRINVIICNSVFTKKFIDKEFGVKSMVIYPPVDDNNIKPKHKENIILYVGRFSKILQSKGQDILIGAFMKMCEDGLRDWKLVLAGGVEVGVGRYINDLKFASRQFPIEIIESPDFDTLKDLYGKAKIFWSASGFGQNEMENPEKMEHFGITVVEAMFGGAVPIVFDGGGHIEIVEEGVNGYLWNSIEDLVEKTSGLIENNRILHVLEEGAKEKSKQYDIKTFEEKVSTIIK